MGVRAAGTEPVEVVPTRAPPSTVELGDRDLKITRAVLQLHRAVGPANGQLPADLGLDLVRFGPVLDGALVQGTAGTSREAGPVEEDASAVDDLGLAGVVLPLGPVALRQ